MVSIVKNKVAVFEKMYLHYDFLALGCEVGVCFKKKNHRCTYLLLGNCFCVLIMCLREVVSLYWDTPLYSP